MLGSDDQLSVTCRCGLPISFDISLKFSLNSSQARLANDIWKEDGENETRSTTETVSFAQLTHEDEFSEMGGKREKAPFTNDSPTIVLTLVKTEGLIMQRFLGNFHSLSR